MFQWKNIYIFVTPLTYMCSNECYYRYNIHKYTLFSIIKNGKIVITWMVYVFYNEISIGVKTQIIAPEIIFIFQNMIHN